MEKEIEEDIKKEKKVKKLPKEVSQEILKKVFKNLLIAIGILIYFAVLNIAYSKMPEERLLNDLKAFAGAFLVFGIFLLEKAYKKEDGANALHGIELIILSGHTLSITHIITMYKYNFQLYLLASSYVFAIYFVFKSILLYTRGKKEYLEKLSDISEIVKEEPIKKEATKKKKQEKNTEDKVKNENVKGKQNSKKEAEKETNKKQLLISLRKKRQRPKLKSK